MNRPIALVIGTLIVVILVGFNTTYTVNFHELAIRTRFGAPKGVEREPGLHFKAPFFIDQVEKIDTRQQLTESPLETVQTRDGQQVLVQAFMLWKVEDADDDGALEFLNSYGSLDAASDDLENQLQAAMRVVGGFDFDDLVGPDAQLADAEDAIKDVLAGSVRGGIRPVTVGIVRVALPEKTTVSVLRRMEAVQETLAQLERQRGEAEAQAITGQANTQADTIRNFAELWASNIRAKGDEEATRYYTEMREHADLAVFLAWLDTLRASLSGNTTFLVDTSRAPFHLLDLQNPTDASGIPQPPTDIIAPLASESRGGTDGGDS